MIPAYRPEYSFTDHEKSVPWHDTTPENGLKSCGRWNMVWPLCIAKGPGAASGTGAWDVDAATAKFPGSKNTHQGRA